MHRKQKFNGKKIIARSNIAIQHKFKHINVSGDFSSAKITKSFKIWFQIKTKTTSRKISWNKIKRNITHYTE